MSNPSATHDTLCMHESGCDKIATRFEADAAHWHDWIWCDAHAEGRTTEPLTDPLTQVWVAR